MKLIKVLIAIIVIGVVIIVVHSIEKSIRYNVKICEVGEVETDVYPEDRVGTYYYIKHEDKEIDNIFPKASISLEELSSVFGTEIDIDFEKNKNYLCSVGKRITNLEMLCLGDEMFVATFYRAMVEYDETSDSNKLYIYEINRTDLSFVQMEVMEEFGKTGDVKLVVMDDDFAKISVFWDGKMNPLLVEDCEYRYDPILVAKVYFYKYETPYLYTINKWGEYMVFNVNKKKIVCMSDDIDELTRKHRNVFESIESFNDISYIDEIAKENSIDIRDGTVFLENVGSCVFLCDERKYIHLFSGQIIKSFDGLIKYYISDDMLYITNSSGDYYYVYNFNTFEEIMSCDDINDLLQEQREVFELSNQFITFGKSV